MMLEKSEYSLQGYSDNDYNKLRLYSTIKNKSSIDYQKNTISFYYTNKTEDGPHTDSFKGKLIGYPTYFYGFTNDIDLWYILKFYPIGEDKIIAYEHNWGHNYQVVIKYLGKEEITVPHGTVLCHKFKMEPNSFIYRLLAKDIFIWLTAEDESMYMIKYKNDNVRDLSHPRIEFRLAEIKDMNPEEWERFKNKYKQE